MLLRVLSLGILLPLIATAEPYSALQDGETLRYRVSWGIFHSAGEITIGARREIADGHPVFRVKMHTTSRGIIRAFYSYDEYAEALIDEASGRIVHATEKATASSVLTDSETSFDYSKRILTHRDQARPGRNRELPIPAGNPIDLLSALVQTRDWQIPPGEKRPALIYTGNDIYPLSIHALRIESVKTPNGRHDALLLVPRMEEQPPRGIFKRGGEIKVWVTQGSNRQPVKMQLKLNLGTAVLTLVERTVMPTPPEITKVSTN